MTPKKTGAAAIACGLALTMSLGMGFASTASAATVTFDKDLQSQSVSNRIFNAYKLATVKTTGDTTTYTFVSDEVRDAIKTVLTKLDVADVDKADTDVALSGLIAGLDNSKKVAFASQIATAVAGIVTPTTINGNSGELDDFGYYVITENTTDGSVVKVTPFLLETSDKDITSTLKSSQPSIDKEIVSADKKDSKYDDVNIGDDVKFELNDMKVPDTYGYDTYTYTITDTMSKGLTLTKAQVDALTLTIGGQSVAAGDDTYTVTVDGTKASELADGWSAKGATIVITFKDTYFIGTYGAPDASGKVSYTQNPAAGSAIKVNFSATLNEDAKVATPENNTVKLTYTNDTCGTTNSTEHKVYVYTYGIEVDKTFSDGKNLFSKVEFGLTGDKAIYVTGSNGKYTVVNENTAGAQKADSGLKLDADGHIEIKGLDAGTYTLTETKVPTGYKSDGPKTITIKPNYGTSGSNGKQGLTAAVEDDKDADGYVDATVINKPETFQLPQTGAAGMILLPMIGIGAMAGAAITLRRKAQSNK